MNFRLQKLVPVILPIMLVMLSLIICQTNNKEIKQVRFLVADVIKGYPRVAYWKPNYSRFSSMIYISLLKLQMISIMQVITQFHILMKISNPYMKFLLNNQKSQKTGSQ